MRKGIWVLTDAELNSLPLPIAVLWALLVATVCVGAATSIWYVRRLARRNQDERYRRFRAILQQIADPNGPVVAKVAAAHELKQYKEYADIVAHVFRNGEQVVDEVITLQKRLSEKLDEVANLR